MTIEYKLYAEDNAGNIIRRADGSPMLSEAGRLLDENLAKLIENGRGQKTLAELWVEARDKTIKQMQGIAKPAT